MKSGIDLRLRIERGIDLPKRGFRPPHIVEVFGFPARDGGIGLREVEQREQAAPHQAR
jgi:hypothetical protein